MTAQAQNSRILTILTGGSLAFYLLCGLVYAHTSPLFSDDYYNVRAICQLFWGKPYIDFQPWNNLLGHYIQTPAFLINPDPVFGPINIRIELALLNTLALLLLVRHVRQTFSPAVALAGLLVLITMDYFVMTSVMIRLDMLASWAGFAALMLACAGRWGLAGLFCALSFLISQKGIYQIACLNFALAALFCLTPERAKTFWRGVRFNLNLTAVTGLYYLLVFLAWNPGRGITDNYATKAGILSTFYHTKGFFERSMIYIFERNYLFTALILAGLVILISALIRDRKPAESRQSAPYQRKLILIAYLGALAVCCCLHPHPYAYFFIITIPALWYCSCYGLQWIFQRFESATAERKTAATTIAAALLLLFCWLLIPRPLWTESFFHWMCLLSPLAMLAVCLPLYLFCRRVAPARPAILSGIFLGLSLLIILCASDLRRIAFRLEEPVSYNAMYAQWFIGTHTPRVRAILHGKPFPPSEPFQEQIPHGEVVK